MMIDRFDEQCEGEHGMYPAENGQFCYADDAIAEVKRLQDIIDTPVVFNGKSAAEWCSMHAQSSLRLAKAEGLLRRAYEARQKWHWKEGESEGQVMAAISDYLHDHGVNNDRF